VPYSLPQDAPAALAVPCAISYTNQRKRRAIVPRAQSGSDALGGALLASPLTLPFIPSSALKHKERT